MNPEMNHHVPRPEFRANLEWEIARTHRRIERQSLGARPRNRRILSTIGLVMVGIMIGTLSSVATAQVQNAGQREQLLVAARAEVDLASRRFQEAQAAMTEVRQRYDAGVITPDVLEEADARLNRTEAMLSIALLKVEEIQATSRPARDDLSAPRVDGRDFVGERLAAELRALESGLASVEKRVAEAERRLRLGMTSQLPVSEARAELLRANAVAYGAAIRLSLREAFLEGELGASAVVQEGQRLELANEVPAAEAGLEIAESRLETVRIMEVTGQIGEVEVKRAELEVAEKRAELEELRARIEMLATPGQ